MERKEAIEVIKKNWPDSSFTMLREALETLIPELKESEDERIRKALKEYFINSFQNNGVAAILGVHIKDILIWLEAQGEHAKFLDSIQVGDKVTRNKDGVLVNLSQLNRVAKKNEKQGEQKPTDKTEPKFKVGDWVVTSYGKVNQVVSVDKDGDGYTLDDGVYFSGSWCDMYHLWTIQDAKEGDVLVNEDGLAFIYNYYLEEQQYPFAYGGINLYGRFNLCDSLLPFTHQKVHPATKEQRDILEKAMADAGYTFDFEKKELKKIEQKPAWSEEDEKNLFEVIMELEYRSGLFTPQPKDYSQMINWLKSLRPQSTWKPSDEEMNSFKQAINSFPYETDYLDSLYEDLKKLREE